MKRARCVMELTRRDVQEALRRLMRQRREVNRLRGLARRPEEIERLNRVMEQIQRLEQQRLAELKKCPR
jgi:hypothetical protein